MKTSAVRYAIVGCGNVAARHARAIADLEEARLVTAVDGVPERAARLAAEYGADVCSDIDELACRSDIDAVVLSLPSPIHTQVGMCLADSGKHLLVEKPIAVDASAADELVACSKARGVALSVVSQHRFHDDMVWLKDLTAEGKLGRPVLVSTLSLWRRDQAYYDAAPGRGRHDPGDGGVLLNQAVHALDLLLWLFGPARRVQAERATLTHDIAVEDTATATVLLSSGALATVITSTSVYSQTGERLEVRFEEGTVVFQGGRVVEIDAPFNHALPPPSSRVPVTGSADGLEPFRRQHRDFVEAIRTGRAPTVTGAEGRAVVDLIQAAYHASTEGIPVDLPFCRVAALSAP